MLLKATHFSPPPGGQFSVSLSPVMRTVVVVVQKTGRSVHDFSLDAERQATKINPRVIASLPDVAGFLFEEVAPGGRTAINQYRFQAVADLAVAEVLWIGSGQLAYVLAFPDHHSRLLAAITSRTHQSKDRSLLDARHHLVVLPGITPASNSIAFRTAAANEYELVTLFGLLQGISVDLVLSVTLTQKSYLGVMAGFKNVTFVVVKKQPLTSWQVICVQHD